MRIRHLVTRDNVDPDSGFVSDPSLVRHGIIVAGRVAGLAGAIDPATHLNLDFPEHRVTHCLVVEAFSPGAEAVTDGDGFAFALVHPAHYGHLGRVDQDAGRLAWHTHFANNNANHIANKGTVGTDESLRAGAR